MFSRLERRTKAGPRSCVRLVIPVLILSGCGAASNPTPDRVRVDSTLPCTNPVCDDSYVYIAAIDTVIDEFRRMTQAADSDEVRLLPEVRWWPGRTVDGKEFPAVGPLPFGLGALSRAMGLQLSYSDNPPIQGQPGLLLVLSPIDYRGNASAVVRVGTYAVESRTVLQVILVRTDGRWKPKEVLTEWQN